MHTYANAEHQADLGAHRDYSTKNAARGAVVFANTLRQTSGSAQRTQRHEHTCHRQEQSQPHDMNMDPRKAVIVIVDLH
jgi:6-phosphogluconolactonase (cycloisomerase 2 family)